MTRRIARTRRWIAVAAFALLTFVGMTVSAAASTHGAPATVTKPNGTPLTSGGSEKRFTVALPRGAACPRDRTHGSRVYSYLVPEGTDVGHVTFASSIPSIGFGLFVAPTGSYYGKEDTAVDGRIIRAPTFEWALMLGTNGGAATRSELLNRGSSGIWDGGLACVDPTGHVTHFWNFSVMFVKSHSDAHGFTWCPVPGAPSQVPEVPHALMLPLVGAVVVGGYAGARRRRASRSQTV